MIADELEDMASRGEPLPAEIFTIERPVSFGPTSGTETISIEGAGRPYNSPFWPRSTSIVATFDDAPAVTLRGGRGSSIRNLGIYGPLPILYETTLLDTPDRSGWPGIYDRYSPCAGLVIDDTAGGGSEHTLVESVEIGGFWLGLGTHVNGTNGNGDYPTVRDCRFAGLVVAIDVCHDQGRVLRVEGGEAIYCHTFLTNRLHGMQKGKVGGHVVGMGFNGVYQLCDLSPGDSGPVRFATGYGELIGWFGDFTDGGARTAIRTSFVDMDLTFNLQCRPGILSQGSALLLDGGSIQCDDIPVFGSEVQVRGTKFRPGRYEDGSTYSYARRKAANSFPLLDPPHPAKTGRKWEDVGTTAYFPGLSDPTGWPEQYQIGYSGSWPVRSYASEEKSNCTYDPATETLTFAHLVPKAGNVVQDDLGKVAWIVTEGSNHTAKLERLNDLSVAATGSFYLVRV